VDTTGRVEIYYLSHQHHTNLCCRFDAQQQGKSGWYPLDRKSSFPITGFQRQQSLALSEAENSLKRLLALPLNRLGKLCDSLWSSGQSSWLQIQRSGFDCRRYQIFWEVVGLERSPLSFVSIIEELLGRKSSGSGLESRENGRRDPSRSPCGTLYPQKLALTSSTSCGRSVDIARSRIQATEFKASCILVPEQLLYSPECLLWQFHVLGTKNRIWSAWILIISYIRSNMTPIPTELLETCYLECFGQRSAVYIRIWG
jgi:hypothetical protein